MFCTTNGESKKNKIPDIIPVEKNLNDELLKYFRGEKNGYVQVGPKKWFLPFKYEKMAQEIVDFEVRSDDIWIMGIPRSGTTVIHDIAWRLTHEWDHNTGKEDMTFRVPFFERNLVFNETSIKERLKTNPEDKERLHIVENTLNILNKLTDRRVIKSHLAFELLPPDILKKGCKVIYVCRYPKDTAFSYYSLQKTLWHINFVGDFEKYWRFYKNGNTMFGPYFEHVRQGYEKRHLDNVLFIFYEDFRKDLNGHIKKIANFLGKSLTDGEQKRLEDFFNFQNYQRNAPKAGTFKNVENKDIQFVRKGTVGGSEEHFTPEMNEEAKEWIDKNTKEIGIEYPIEQH